MFLLNYLFYFISDIGKSYEKIELFHQNLKIFKIWLKANKIDIVIIAKYYANTYASIYFEERLELEKLPCIICK